MLLYNVDAVGTTFIKNERYTHSKVSVCMNSNQQKKRRLAKEKMP